MYSKSVSVFLTSLSFVVLGVLSFMKSMSYSCDTILHVLYKIIPASLAIGILGFLIGSVMDYAKAKK